MPRKTWRRRDFSRNLGLAVVASPFVQMLQSQPAVAQVPGKAKYLVVFYTTGTHPDLWEPKGSTPTSINFSEMNEPLAAIKEDLVIVEGLDSGNTADGHGGAGGLTGFNHGQMYDVANNRGRDSIERWTSDQLKKQGVRTAISELVLGGVASQSPTDFFRAGQAILPIESVSQSYANIFSGAPAPVAQPTPGQATGNTAEAAAAERLLARRQSTLDQVTVELNLLKQSLGAQEARIMDHHLTSIRAVEQRLALQVPMTTPVNSGQPAATPVECNAPGQPPARPLHQSWVDQSDLAVAALGCDLTRIACIQYGHHQEAIVDIDGVGNGDWHNGWLHTESGMFTPLVNMERWVASQFVRTCDQLKAAPAPGGGSLWDQTLVVWTRDFGDAVSHSSVNNMRIVYSGGAGGYLQKSPNGRYLKQTGELHIKSLFNMSEALGVTNLSDYGHNVTVPLDGVSA